MIQVNSNICSIHGYFLKITPGIKILFFVKIKYQLFLILIDFKEVRDLYFDDIFI